MATEGGTAQDVEPLLINQPLELGEWSRHNDTNLSHQKTVLNLNNRHVRLTLWCLVYIVLTTTQIANNLYQYIWFEEMNEEWWGDPTEIDDEKQYYSLGISTNSILWLAAAIFLCSLYCACCKMDCNNCTVFLFIVGSVMAFATMIHGTQKECADEAWDFEELGVGICRSLFVGSGVFLAVFSFYLGIDIIKSIGDNIRIRLFVKSLLISLRSFLLFAYWNKWVDLYIDEENDVGPARYYSAEFAFRTLSGGNLVCGIVCILIILIIGISYASHNNKTIHPFIPRLLSYFLLGGTGATMILSVGIRYIHMAANPAYSQTSTYYVVAAGLLVYDLQYL